MVKYYFFIGQMNANSGEILRILKKEKADFMYVPKNQHGAHEISAQELLKIRELGYKPVFIGIHNSNDQPNSFGYPYFDLEKSPLAAVLNLLHLIPNRRQRMIMRYNQGLYFYNRFSVINYLIVDGASRKEIEAIQLFDRQSHEINQEFELIAEEALNKASANPLCNSELGSQTIKKDLLVIDFNTDFPFGREYYTEYLTITDRAYWHQRYQNLIIFDNNIFFYSGFTDLAETLRQKHPSMNYCGYGCIAFSWKKNDKIKLEILNYLLELTTNKLENGVLF